MADINHRVGIRAPAAQVYAALSTVDGLAGWWTRATSGEAQPGGTLTFRFHDPAGDDIGGFGMDVLDATPDRTVRWRVKDGPQEWIGTEIDFSLARDGDYTIVLFGHRNWPEAREFMAHCSTKWATFLISLKELVETGRGRPSPDDVKIDNWN
jgi:uncharacterized protein YndB with AHSA1/START domain